MSDHAVNRADTEEPLDTDALLDRYKRTCADLANLSQRTSKRIAQATDIAEERVLREFLPVVDSFRRCFDAIPLADGPDARQQVLDGVKLIFSQFMNTLESLGAKGFDAAGQKFAAELMEAVAQVPTRRLAPGMVESEIAQGFTRNGKLLRAAQVTVAVAEQPQDES